MSEPVPAVDAIGEALHLLRMSGVFYCRCEMSAPWGLELPPLEGMLMFHVPTSGRCWLEIEGSEPQLLEQGDLALVPHGTGHQLGSDVGAPGDKLFDRPRELLSERYEILRIHGGGESTGLICGAVQFDHPAARRLVRALPRVIRLEADHEGQLEWMRGTLRLMALEASELKPGGEAVITRLADIVIIQAIRLWLERDPAARTGWLGALRDPKIGRALTLIHREPARDWTVAELASEVAMSRSAFAARFSDLVHETPMHYVTLWRMQVAVERLREEDSTVSEVAFRLGYQSEAAFSRAFKRAMGYSPGAARRRTEASGAVDRSLP